MAIELVMRTLELVDTKYKAWRKTSVGTALHTYAHLAECGCSFLTAVRAAFMLAALQRQPTC